MSRSTETTHRDSVEAVLANTGTCILGCLDATGHPYLIPLLYEYADGGIYLVALEQTSWSEYLHRDGRVTVYITSGARRVLMRGYAQQVDEPLYMQGLLDRRLATSSKPTPSAGRKPSSGLPSGHDCRASDPEQDLVYPEPSPPTWFFVRSLGVFIQRGSVWMRHRLTPIRSGVTLPPS